MDTLRQLFADVGGRLEAVGAGHPLVQAVLVALASLALARLSQWVLTRWVARLLHRTTTTTDDRLLDLLQRPLFFTVLAVGLSIAVQLAGLPEPYETATLRVLRTVVILLWLVAILEATGVMVDVLGRHRHRFALVEDRTLPLFANLSKVVSFLGAVYLVLKTWSIDATALLTSAGIVGIALGFAAKDTLANLFSGMFILADTPYKLGDFIVLDTGERGRVTAVGLRSTRLLTRDDIEITVPNAVIANAKIINETGGPHEKERVRVKVGVAYGSDLDRVCAVLEQTAVDHERVCADPEPRARFRSFGDSGVDFELLAWIDQPIERGRVIHELGLAIYRAFGREGIEIPYPKRDVYLHTQTPGEDPA